MSEQRRNDPGLDPSVEAAVSPVTPPSTPGWLRSTRWRLPAIAFLIAFVAFEAGAQLGSGGGLTPATTVPQRSSFAASFDAASIILSAGLGCSGGGSSAMTGIQSYAITSSRCPVAPAQQAAAIASIERQISAAVRANAITRDGGLSGPSNDGPTVMSWDYRSGDFDGSVYLVVDRTSTDVGVAVVLDEHVRR